MSDRNIFIIGSTVFYLITTILMFTFLTTFYLNFKDANFVELNKIGENWKRGQIMTIGSDNKEECSEDYTPIITDMWQGIEAGCYCSYSFDSNGPLRRDSCKSNKDDGSVCSELPSISPISYQYWKGAKICANRSSANYLELNIAKDAKSCEKGTKSCGMIDSLDNVLCVPKLSACPINYIKVIDKENPPSLDFKYTAVNLTEGLQIIFSIENVKGRILNEFVLSEDQPCADYSQENSREGLYLLNPFHKRSDCSSPIGDYIHDYRYQQVDEYNNIKILTENNILPLVNRVRIFKPPHERNVGLFSRGFIGLNPHCTSEMKDSGKSIKLIFDYLLGIKEHYSLIIKMSLVLLIMGTFLLLIVIAITVIILFCNITDSELKNVLLFYIAPFVIVFIIFIIFLVFWRIFSKCVFLLEYLTRRDCVDFFTYHSMKICEDILRDSLFLSIMGAAITGFQFFIPIVYFVILCYWEKFN